MLVNKVFDFLYVPFGNRLFCYWDKNIGNQIPVYSKQQIIELIEEYNGVMNVGLSVGTFVDGMPFLLFLPFDLDSKSSLKQPLIDAIKLYNALAKLGYKVAMHFSAKKGYHVLLQTVPKIYSKNQIRRAQLYFKLLLNLKTLDKQTLGDARRIIRIPGTFHNDGGLSTIIMHQDGNLFDISDFYPDDIEYQIYNNSKEQIIKKINHPYPCIDLNISEDPEPSQLLRYAWVCLRRDEGKKPMDMLLEATKIHANGGWEDFNADKTLYQIYHILGKQDYSVPSCKTLELLGYCLKEDCPYYNNFKPLKIKKTKEVKLRNE